MLVFWSRFLSDFRLKWKGYCEAVWHATIRLFRCRFRFVSCASMTSGGW
jgi:hypothetical protein